MQNNFNFVSYTKISKNNSHVFLNGEFFGTFNSKILDQLKICAKSNIGNEQLFKLNQILFKLCKTKAFQILSIRDYSKFELYTKLKKIANEKTVNEVVELMQNLGFIHDLKYAENLAEKLITQKFYSKNRTIFELKLKGIDELTATNAVNSLKISPEIIIKKLIKKKYAKKLNNDLKSKNKIIHAIMQKGHSFNETLHAVNSFQNSND